MKRKIVSLLLAAILVLSLGVNALAAHVTPALSKTEIKAGETVDVILSINEEVQNIVSLQYDVYYDSDLFTLTSSAKGESNAKTVISSQKTDAEGKPYYSVLFVDNSDNGDPQTFTADTLYTLTFTAKADIEADATATFKVLEKALSNADYTSLRDKNYTGILNVTVKFEQPQAAGYTVTVSPAEQTANPEDTVTVHVNVTSGDADHFNAVDMKFDYSKYSLELLTKQIEGLTIEEIEHEQVIEGMTTCIHVHGYGPERAIGTGFDLQFKCIKNGQTKVRMTSAKVGESEQAIGADAPEATWGNAASTVTVSGYPVTYDPACADWFTGAPTSAEVNGTIIFVVKDKHYDYDFTGTTVGNDPAEVTVSSGGNYRISSINGPVYVTATRTPKKYDVEVSGTASADVKAEDGTALPEKATYLTDFVFILDKDPDYTYTDVTVTRDGVNYPITPAGNKYTIPGADVTGKITISVDKTAITAGKFDVTGLGGDVTGDAQATEGQPYTFTVTQDPNYDYTISVKVGDEDVTPTDNGDGTYTIPGDKVTGAITITVTKTAKPPVVEVYPYLNFDGKTMYLIVVKGAIDEGKVFTYGKNAMFWSEKYGGYASLTVENEELTVEAATAKVDQATAEKAEIEYLGDVNMTYHTDINDAQLVYDMYNAKKYEDFSRVSMEKFLRADVNGDKKVDTEDAVAVVSLIR